MSPHKVGRVMACGGGFSPFEVKSRSGVGKVGCCRIRLLLLPTLLLTPPPACTCSSHLGCRTAAFAAPLLQDAADRDRLGASTFKNLNLGEVQRPLRYMFRSNQTDS